MTATLYTRSKIATAPDLQAVRHLLPHLASETVRPLVRILASLIPDVGGIGIALRLDETRFQISVFALAVVVPRPVRIVLVPQAPEERRMYNGVFGDVACAAHVGGQRTADPAVTLELLDVFELPAGDERDPLCDAVSWKGSRLCFFWGRKVVLEKQENRNTERRLSRLTHDIP